MLLSFLFSENNVPIKYFLKVCKECLHCVFTLMCAIAHSRKDWNAVLWAWAWTGCFAPATFLVQSRGWTRCPQDFSVLQFLWLWNKCSDRNIHFQMSCWHCLWGLKCWCGTSPFPNRRPSDAVTPLPVSGSKWHKTCCANSEPGTMKLNWNSFVRESHP